MDNLSEAQLCDVFSGKIKSWKEIGGSESKITVLARKQDDNNMASVRDNTPCFKSLQLSPDAILLGTGVEVLDALQNRAGTIGVTSFGANTIARPNIKAVGLANVTPNPEALRSGKYKYYTEIGLVTSGEPKGPAKRLLDFAATPEGGKVFDKFGIVILH